MIHVLTEELELPGEQVRKRVEKVSALERIRTNVPKETGDKIREYNLPGVKVDEDFKRYYHTGRWPPGSWALREAITRASSVWRQSTRRS